MSRLPIILIIILVSHLLLTFCQSPSQANQDEKVEAEESNESATPLENTTSTKFSSEATLKNYLSEEGFLLSVDGKEIIREDQLAQADPKDLAAGIAILEKDPEKNKLVLLYLKVAGSALDDAAASDQFINEVILANDDYLKHMDQMVKFQQRQDRPTFKKALLNTIKIMSDDQCLAYLEKIGYLMGTSTSFSYNPKALVPLPMFVKIAIVDKLRKSKGQGLVVCNQLKVDLNIAS